MVKFKTLNKEKLDKTFYEKAKEKKGITLIALVITIIVLLILVGVSLNLILGEDDGIVNRSISARNTHNRESIREKVIMAMYDLQIDGKETNADNVKADLISSNYYTDDEVEVLSDTKIKINGEVFEIDKINSNPTVSNPEQSDPENPDPEDPNPENPDPDPDPVPTLAENVAEATEELTKQGITPNTKTIKQYLYDEKKYGTGEIEDKPNGDFNDTLIVGKGTPEEQTAEVPTNRYTVYFEKPSNWDANNVNAYVWYKDSNQNVTVGEQWPGTKLQSIGDNIYKFELPEVSEGYPWQKIIFNNGSGSNKQTDDLNIGQKGQVFRIAPNDTIIYSNCVENWLEPLYLYAWKTDTNGKTTQNAAWPGEQMTSINADKKIYKYDMGDNGWQYFIINNGTEEGHKQQTFNMQYQGGNRIYCVNGKDDYAKDSSDNNKSKMKESYNAPYEKALTGQWVDRTQ